MASFRVSGKIFATAPPGGDLLHVFVDESEVRACVAEDPAAFEPLRWEQRIRGLRVRLAAAPAGRVAELIEGARPPPPPPPPPPHHQPPARPAFLPLPGVFLTPRGLGLLRRDRRSCGPGTASDPDGQLNGRHDLAA